ncbi:uncharacterized protein [Palaemon carinicauda]|uniref:uncharacterized protein n=1 Tax=Palaemon carinicauda TaxID=392227 RepID=UPI0035B592B5
MLNKIERLQDENFEHEGLIESLARQVEFLTGELDGKHSAMLKIESLKYDLEREREELLEEIGRLRDMNEDLARINSDIKKENNDKDGDIEKLKDEVADKEWKINHIENLLDAQAFKKDIRETKIKFSRTALPLLSNASRYKRTIGIRRMCGGDMER